MADNSHSRGQGEGTQREKTMGRVRGVDASFVKVLGDSGIVEEGRGKVDAMRRGRVPQRAGGGTIMVEDAQAFEEVHWLRGGKEAAGARNARRGR